MTSMGPHAPPEPTLAQMTALSPLNVIHATTATPSGPIATLGILDPVTPAAIVCGAPHTALVRTAAITLYPEPLVWTQAATALPAPSTETWHPKLSRAGLEIVSAAPHAPVE